MRYILVIIMVTITGCQIPLKVTNVPQPKESLYTVNDFSDSDKLLIKAIELSIQEIKVNEKDNTLLYIGYLKEYNTKTKLEDRSIDGYFEFMFGTESSPMYYCSGGGYWQRLRNKVKAIYGGLSNEKK